eukprot:scaffold120430_cov21-Tisochrysis_lutea.AAC.1
MLSNSACKAQSDPRTALARVSGFARAGSMPVGPMCKSSAKPSVLCRVTIHLFTPFSSRYSLATTHFTMLENWQVAQK